MMTFTYTEARTQLAALLDKAADQPVIIRRQQGTDVVVINAEQFSAFQQAKFDAAHHKCREVYRDTLKALAEK